MPRRNRQKLHKELRLRAEARKRSTHRARLARREEQARIRALAEATLAGKAAARRPATTSRLDAEISSIRGLCRLARVPREQRLRVERTCRAVGTQVPSLAVASQLPWFLLLSGPTWVRQPDTWRAPGGSVRRKRDSLAAHLLARFPVPAFLLRALDSDPLAVARVPVEDAWAVVLLAHVGQGASLRALVGSPALPTPLTRKMCHALMAAKATTSPIEALRSAQVAGFGGPPHLAHLLARTRLGRLWGTDARIGERFWHEALAWLCTHERLHGLRLTELERLLAWLEHRRRDTAGPPLDLRRLTAARARSEAEAWTLCQRRAAEPGSFPASGLLELQHGAWTLHEVRTRSALAEEGRAMGHCAWSYRTLIRKGKVALWSLRAAGVRVATVEVALGAARVVQAKRKHNRPIDSDELAVIRRWAALNRLAVQRHL